MEDRLIAAIDSQREKFELWSEKFMYYVDTSITYEIKVTDEEGVKATKEFVRVLNDIIQFGIKFGAVKDTWTETKFYMLVTGGVMPFVHSQKTGSEYSFGFDRQGFFFELWPKHLNNLRYVGDDFWKLFLNLKEHGDLEIVQSEFNADPEAKKVLKRISNNKSEVFKLIRDYILFEIYSDETPAFIKLVLRWQPNLYWDEILNKFSLAFKDFYKIDYLLWHPSYQKQHNGKSVH